MQQKSSEGLNSEEPVQNNTTLAEPVVQEDSTKAFPNAPTTEVPVETSAEELKKLEELHAKKGGEVKVEEEKKNDTKKALVTTNEVPV